jgi:hypothetical protein
MLSSVVPEIIKRGYVCLTSITDRQVPSFGGLLFLTKGEDLEGELKITLF